MQVKMNNQVKYFENDHTVIDRVLEEIHQRAEETGLVFTHIKVDGIEVRSDFADYLEQNIDRINLIEVEMISPERLQMETLASAHAYLQRALPEVKILTDEFYQGASGDAWERFAQLLEGLLWLNQLIMVVDQSVSQPSNWGQIKETYDAMENAIESLGAAMEEADLILIADLLNYEIIPSLEEIGSGIEKTLAPKGEKDDLN